MQLELQDVAALFEVSEAEVFRWIDQEEIPFRRVNHELRFSRSELLEWATLRKRRIPAALVADTGEPASLAGALELGGIHHHLRAVDRRSALEAVVSLLPLPEAADRPALLQLLLAREAAGSTSLGEGIAIPHVRYPLVYGVPRASATLCFLETPVDFAAGDGLPVRILFTLVCPTVRAHLRLLSLLAHGLSTPEFRARVTGAAGAEEIRAAARGLAFPASGARR